MDRIERRFPEAPIEFGVRVYETRKSKRLSQEDLAEMADIHVTYVSQLEQGKRNPSLDVMLRMADALDVDLRDLVNGLQNTRKTPEKRRSRSR